MSQGSFARLLPINVALLYTVIHVIVYTWMSHKVTKTSKLHCMLVCMLCSDELHKVDKDQPQTKPQILYALQSILTTFFQLTYTSNGLSENSVIPQFFS